MPETHAQVWTTPLPHHPSPPHTPPPPLPLSTISAFKPEVPWEKRSGDFENKHLPTAPPSGWHHKAEAEEIQFASGQSQGTKYREKEEFGKLVVGWRNSGEI